MSSFNGYRGGRGGRGNRGGGGGGRSFGGGGGGRAGRGRGPPPAIGHGGEKFELSICRFYVKGACTNGDKCAHLHAVTLLANVDVAPQHTAVNDIVQWNDNSVFTATDEGVVKMYSTTNGTTWEPGVQVPFTPGLAVTALHVAGNFIFCGYEAHFPYSAAATAAAAAAGGGAAAAGASSSGATTTAGGRVLGGAASGDGVPHAVTVGMIRVHNLTGGDPQTVEIVVDPEKQPWAHPRRVNCLTVSTDATTGAMLLYSGGDHGLIRIWKALGTGFQMAATLDLHVRGVTRLLLAGPLLWSASKDSSIRVWDTASCACIGLIAASIGDGHHDVVTAMTGPINVEGDSTQYIVTGSRDNTLKVWNAATGDKVHEHDCKCKIQSVAAVASSPTGPLLLVGYDDGSIAVRDFPGFLLAFELSAENFHVGHYRTPVTALLPLVVAGPEVYFMSGGCDGKMLIWKMTAPAPTA